MERVEGIGGFLFSESDPVALAAWYAEHLGVSPPPASYDAEDLDPAGGPVFAPFSADEDESPNIGRGGWGINFRVGPPRRDCGPAPRRGHRCKGRPRGLPERALRPARGPRGERDPAVGTDP